MNEDYVSTESVAGEVVEIQKETQTNNAMLSEPMSQSLIIALMAAFILCCLFVLVVVLKHKKKMKTVRKLSQIICETDQQQAVISMSSLSPPHPIQTMPHSGSVSLQMQPTIITPQSVQNEINALIVGNSLMMNELMTSTVTPMGPSDMDGDELECSDYDDLIEGDATTGMSKVCNRFPVAKPMLDNGDQSEESDDDILSDVNMMHTPMGDDEDDEGTNSISDKVEIDDIVVNDDDRVITKGKTEEYKHVQSDEFIIDSDEQNDCDDIQVVKSTFGANI